MQNNYVERFEGLSTFYLFVISHLQVATLSTIFQGYLWSSDCSDPLTWESMSDLPNIMHNHQITSSSGIIGICYHVLFWLYEEVPEIAVER